MGDKKKGRSERGIAVIMTALMLVFVIPVIGLSVDCGILYAVKTKLSAAVDAGALAGARALSRGLDDSSQQSSAQSTATSFVNMNFPPGYFAATAPIIPTPTIDESVANQRSVALTATTTVPLLFMRWLGYSTMSVTASATATRRDVNIMIAMDRSGSLANSGSCAPLTSAAQNFANMFANGRDNMGLVTFATSSMVDFPIATNFLSASPSNIPSILGSLTCTGGTNTGQGLWQAYTELTRLGQPNALNVLILFTDGYPNTFTGSFVTNTTYCASANPKLGVLAAGYYTGAPTTPVGSLGLFNPVATAQPMTTDSAMTTSDSTGCAYASNWAGGTAAYVSYDLPYLPTMDTSGNTTNSGYQPVSYAADGIHLATDPTTVQNAGFNAADNAGLRVRQGQQNGAQAGIPNVNLFSIGLGNAGGVPADFLERIANDSRASNWDSTYPTGTYIYAPTSADLGDAFQKIASEILRLAK